MRSATKLEEVLADNKMISLATTAIHPFITSLDACYPGTVLLHVSLRDIVPELILEADNVVDDIDQVCSNQTSLHLAEQQVGHRSFIRTTIGDILNGQAPGVDPNKKMRIFSPFGLGILDIAVGYAVQQMAEQNQAGMQIEGFLPQPWLNR